MQADPAEAVAIAADRGGDRLRVFRDIPPFPSAYTPQSTITRAFSHRAWLRSWSRATRYRAGMPTVILVRHGRSGANVAGMLAGRTPGVRLDETGISQAAAVAERLAGLPLAAVVSSPLDRCRQTATEIARRHDGLKPSSDRRLTECGYGDWTGRRSRTWRRTRCGRSSSSTLPG